MGDAIRTRTVRLRISAPSFRISTAYF